ncbi:MAG: hypothetical protein ACK5MT_19930 [Actinomycetales bacterium]
MQESSAFGAIEPEDGQGSPSQSKVPTGSALESEQVPDSEQVSTVLVEVLPDIAVVYGDVPADVELIEFGLIPTTDRDHLAQAIARAGIASSVGGNLAQLLEVSQGLYRLDATSRALLNQGARLAPKDGANLGTLILPDGGLRQARLIPAAAMTVPEFAAAMGPVLAMVALQMSLDEVNSLVRTNIALTSQLLTSLRNEQWAELTGLTDTIGKAAGRARDLGQVPQSLWDTVASRETALRAARDQYRQNVAGHVAQLKRLDSDPSGRRHYVETNAEAIIFDVYACRACIQAWTEFQMLHHTRARAAGATDPGEAQIADAIARETPAEVEAALAQIRSVVEALMQELRIIAELPGRSELPLTRKRKDAKAARRTCRQLLEAIEPLAEALRSSSSHLKEPEIVCAPQGVDHHEHWRILRWMLEDGETLRCLAFPYQHDDDDVVTAFGHSVLGGIDGEKWANRARLDPERGTTVVAITDRRIITAKPNALRREGEIGDVMPVDRVRYVRAATQAGSAGRSRVDLITADRNLQWLFHADTDTHDVDAFAAVLAESMNLPEAERAALVRKAGALTFAEDDGVSPAELAGESESGAADSTPSIPRQSSQVQPAQ